MRPLLIVKTGTSLPELVSRLGDFEDWIGTRLDVPRERVTVLDPKQDPLPEPDLVQALLDDDRRVPAAQGVVADENASVVFISGQTQHLKILRYPLPTKWHMRPPPPLPNLQGLHTTRFLSTVE